MNTKEILNKKIGYVSLGCDKNRVDLEKIIAMLSAAGFKTTANPREANIIIVNTCSFIENARKESVATILEMANLKNLNCEKLVVTGCINQMNFSDLASSLPEVDAFVKISDNDNIVKTIFNLYNIELTDNNYNCSPNRVLTTPHHYAYLKIAEGCNNFCSYCTIPYIRGRFKSVSMEQLIAEANLLANAGAKEIILVAQDVTKYGYDLYNEYALPKLINKLSEIKNISWIRLMYCYPELVSDKLIDVIKNNNKVVKYIDIPLQHVNSTILKKMNRRTDNNQIVNLITKLKSEIKDISIRSTFILGFPGETKKQFNEVVNFLKQHKLTNVGFFEYSREPNTLAYSMDNQIPKIIKKWRVKKAYKTQEKISFFNNIDLLNKVVSVIIDSSEHDYFVGRTQFNAPEVDQVVYVFGKAKIGDIVNVRIFDTSNYELKGEIYEPTK